MPFLFLKHPGDTNRLVRHESNFHSGQRVIQCRQTELLESPLDARIAVELLSISGGDEELLNTKGNI